MAKSKHRHAHNIKNWVSVSLLTLFILACLLMIIPIHMGVSAGIAAVSVLFFTVTAGASALLIRYGSHQINKLAWTALGASVIGIVLPLAGYMLVAQKHNISLSFNPVSYVTFSGETSLRPSAIHAYKTVGERPLRLAFYESSSKKPGPVVVMIHGGGWRYGNYLQTGNWPAVLTNAGISVVSIEYRLSAPQHPTWQEAPQDIHDAISYIQRNPETFSLRDDQLHLLGQSAGGHLALLEAYRHHGVRSVSALYSPVDLSYDYDTSRDKSAELNFVGGNPQEYIERYRTLSPTEYIDSNAPRTLIIQGTRDDLVAHENASMIGKKLQDNGITHEVILLPFTGHSFENQQGGFATQISEAKVIEFLKK